MNYHAPTRQYTIDPKHIEKAASHMLYAIKKIRIAVNLDLKGYEWTKFEARNLEDASHAEYAIIDAAKAIGIDLGGDRPGAIDVSKA